MPEDFLDPKQILLDHMNPQPGMVAADFGCGSGGWSIPLSAMLEGGKVYAIDIQEEPLSALRSKIASSRIFNIEIVKMDVEKTILRLMDNSIDLVLISNVLFQSKEKKHIVEQAKRIIKPQGKILIIDWEKDAPTGPEVRVSAEDVRGIADGLGLDLVETFKAGGFHYGLVFTKKG